MKKLLTLLMALSMMLTLFTGCATTAAPPASEPEPAPEPVSVSEPPAPSIVEGVVKEASLSKIIVTLADGTDFALDTTGVTGMKANLGDTVKVEYTGAPGSAVASKVEVTAEAPKEIEVTGVVKEVSASMMLLTLEDESELVLLTKDIEGLEVKEGDKVTAKYMKGDTGAVASAVEVVEPATPEGEAAPEAASGASSQSAAPTTPASSSGASTPAPAPNQGGSTGGNGGNQLKSYVDWIKSIGTPEDGDDGSSDGGNSSTRNDNDGENDTQTQPEEKPTETTPDPEPEPEPEPSEDAGDVYEAIELINAERTKAGLAELEIDSDLMSMAATRASEITGNVGHTRPDGSDWKTVFSDYGWETPNKRGENAAGGQKTASKVVAEWMNSSGHKANILKDNVTKIGVGYYYDGNVRYKHFWIMIVTN